MCPKLLPFCLLLMQLMQMMAGADARQGRNITPTSMRAPAAWWSVHVSIGMLAGVPSSGSVAVAGASATPVCSTFMGSWLILLRLATCSTSESGSGLISPDARLAVAAGAAPAGSARRAFTWASQAFLNSSCSTPTWPCFRTSSASQDAIHARSLQRAISIRCNWTSRMT